MGRERIAAAGVTCRRVTDRGISPELARAVDLFHDAMHAWRDVTIDESMTRKLSHRRATVVDDRAVVEALLRAGWTPPGQSGALSAAQTVIEDVSQDRNLFRDLFRDE